MITVELCKGARAMLDWSRAELAERAGISERTLVDFERGARRPLKNNLKAIRAALAEGGICFTEDGCMGPPKREDDA